MNQNNVALTSKEQAQLAAAACALIELGVQALYGGGKGALVVAALLVVVTAVIFGHRRTDHV